MSGERVTTDRSNGVLVVRLARPENRNALDHEQAWALRDALEDTDGVGAVALLAVGENFCVGGDVRAMAAATDPRAFVRSLADEFHRSIRAIGNGPPVVVGVRGWAAGAGLSLVLAADVVVAGQSAIFRPAYPGIGVTPDGGLTWSLPRAVGDRKARGMLLQNETMTVSEAQNFGLVDQVVPDGDVESVVVGLARKLAVGPRDALRRTKQLVTRGATHTLDEQLEAESATIADCAVSPDGQEGLAAFVERRTPHFGRERAERR
jgi:2-(1,2-epoxy-1,2-dihydrophenyl)acetyl-CoA isomerase